MLSKRLTSSILILAVFVTTTLIMPRAAFAAWAATDAFEDYSNGASMNGASGGSGWTGNWAATTWIASTADSYEGSVSARTTTNAMQRTYTAISSGTVTMYVALKRTVAGANDSRFYVLNTAQSGGMGIHFDTSGNIVVSGSTEHTIVTSYTPDQWYVFRVSINRDSWTTTVDYSTDTYGSAGSWTNGVTDAANFGTASDLTYIRYECDNLTGGGFWYTDYISDTSPFIAAAAIKVPDLFWF